MSWSPAALLDPKAKAANASSPGSRPPQASASTPNLAALHRRAQEQTTFQYPNPNGPIVVDFTGAGLGNADHHFHNRIFQSGAATNIERLHNVQDRPSLPQPKRRKTATETDPSPSHIAFAPANAAFAAAGSGILAQHIKEERAGGSVNQASLTPTSSFSGAIDLTDDDSTPKPATSAGDEEVCYGMIEGASINCHHVPAPKPGMVSTLGDGYWPQIKVLLKRAEGDRSTRVVTCDWQHKPFGTVDGKTSYALAMLMDKSGTFGIRTDCKIPFRRRLPAEEVGQQISMNQKFELVLYGARKYSYQIGQFLTGKGLKLVNPPRVELGVKVLNPHAAENRFRLSQPRQQQASMVPPAPAVVRSVEEIRSEVMGVFDSLPKSEDLPEMDPDQRVLTPLLKHQRQALFFMTSRESDQLPDANSKELVTSTWQRKRDRSGSTFYYNVVTGQPQRELPPPTLGGILADMMGLGKTLSVLSLLTKTLDAAEKWSHLEPVQPRAPERRPTQSHEVPRPQALELTRVKRNAKATLLVCPLSTITNWEEQLKQHIRPGSITYYIYHGANRIKDVDQLAGFDLVITTYGSITSELNFRSKKKQGIYPLEEIAWFRIVLDEAHTIREQNTLAFKSICRLQANRRWAVTGTPVQNKLEDLAALLAFLRLKPFDERSKFLQYIIQPFKAANPEIVPKLRVLIDTITLRRLKDKIDLPPRTDEVIRLEFTPDERRVYEWFAKTANDRVQVLTNQGRLVGGRTMIHILRSILQLRLICAHGKDLLSEEDLAELQGISADAPIAVESDDEDSPPVLQESKAYEMLYLMQEGNGDHCFGCNTKLGANEVEDPESDRQNDVLGYMTQCFHVYCSACIRHLKTGGQADDQMGCPSCVGLDKSSCVELLRKRADFEHESRMAKKQAATGKIIPDDRYSGPHTKTRALVQELLAYKAQSEANPDQPPFKSVVFSGWTSHLDLIEIALDQAGIIHTRLDGKMTRLARNAAMDAFRDDPNVQVILVSIMAGGMGLNLTSGNSVFVMEPQFNPAAEAQAVDRVHRLGQKRPVRTVRFIMNDSFEEKMLQLQDKKKKLASLSMDREASERMANHQDAARQRLMDLRSLFK
ncbi:putative SWI/SNF-related matrix-associated actin-dependent regulator of chromatin subfamily A member 3-like 1 [Cladorrhinum samala]|uniref:SWI/SNF-related matrix-associated actin-dependent regulator of chromatin subfamily A member 3-like 1 n=1 Tax=Cladorrhinum samala TaxID=585594 RepID=A0AAV9HWN9_9PEZI|nr:putative SWI/SNF-related matrix-associated actin-dependent regulator of chromatin subfamily A member 3-like 1 [Cladorrhinum samala]